MRRLLWIAPIALFLACNDEENVSVSAGGGSGSAGSPSARAGGASVSGGNDSGGSGGRSVCGGSASVCGGGPVGVAGGAVGVAGGGAGGHTDANPATPLAVKGSAHIGSDGSKPDFQNARIPFTTTGGTYASGSLTVDLTSPCFPFAKWQADPPPAGQNWPADCDAFDRNFEMEIDAAQKDGDPPGIEVIRAITPFGGPEHVTTDLTAVLNGLPAGEHVLSIHITTYSDGAGKVSGSNGGWDVTYDLTGTVGDAPEEVLAVTPLFDGSYDATNVPPTVTFEVPTGATAGRIEVRATGHGGPNTDTGCIGPAEEFCKRTHVLMVDDAQAASSQLWRTDCAKSCTKAHQGPATGGFDYCVENPCGDMNSVKAPRANWCPGTETPPWVLDVSTLTPGTHGFTDDINRIAAGGSWRVSAVYVATK